MKGLTWMWVPVLIFLCPFRSPAQEADSLSFKGKKGLTFSFSGFYLGGGLGGKYWLNNDYALKIMMTGSYEQSKELTDGTTTTSNSLGLTVYLERHFLAERALSPYIGVGSGLVYEYHDAPYYTEPSRTLSVKVPILVGIEYWVTPNISFSGEQNITFNLRVSHSSREYGVSNSTSSLLLSLYF